MTDGKPYDQLMSAFDQARRRAGALEQAVRDHRNATVGHGMCHENDHRLWSLLPDADPYDHTPPGWAVFLWRCLRYRWGRRGCCAACNNKESAR